MALCEKPMTAECCAFEKYADADDGDLTFYTSRTETSWRQQSRWSAARLSCRSQRGSSDD